MSTVSLFRLRNWNRVGAVLLCMLYVGCEEDPAQRLAPSVTIDIAKQFEVSHDTPIGSVKNLCAEGSRSRLTAGWHLNDATDTTEFRAFSEAVVEFSIAKPGDATLRLDLPFSAGSAATGSPLLPAKLQLVWNGQVLDESVSMLGVGAVEIFIAARQQRVGPNRLVLVPMEKHVEGPRFGLSCREISLRTMNPLTNPARGSVTKIASNTRPGGAGRGGSKVLHREGVMTSYLRLPPGAHLAGEGIVRFPKGATLESLRGHVAIHLVEASGAQQALASVAIDPRDRSPVTFDVDLSAWSGQLIALSLAYHAAHPAVSGTDIGAPIEWTQLRIDGFAPSGPPDSEPAIARDRYNVFLILLDSLRADHIEPYGADHVRTPKLAQLADEGVTFLDARSNSSWTRPAVASLLTSLSPSAHGVQKFDDRLSGKLPSLPLILRRLGYRTLAITGNVMVSRVFGFARGFDAMHPHYRLLEGGWPADLPSPEDRASDVWRRYIEKFLASRSGQPFFVYLHEVDPHSPYEVSAPYDRLYTDRDRPELRFDRATIRRIREDPDSIDPDDIRYFHALYRSEITFMDRYVGLLLDRLDEAGLADRTLVVVVSDHGEEFMDHRSVGHGHTLHEELLRVPLIMRLPGVLPAGRRVRVGAQLIDLPPTILDLIGASVPDWMEGESLLQVAIRAPSDTSARAFAARPSFASSIGPAHSSVLLGDWKLIVTHSAKPGGLVQHQLYDLSRDPGEQRDVWASEPIIGHHLRQLLRAKLAEATLPGVAVRRSVPPASLDTIEVRSLRALGYLDPQ